MQFHLMSITYKVKLLLFILMTQKKFFRLRKNKLKVLCSNIRNSSLKVIALILLSNQVHSQFKGHYNLANST